ncbi:hypothetical protein FLM48_15275 [Shewanella sp. Scap07]|uniref:hypothetical protein n=1 Tax=Shewanella sp. Scap07 TaxID=2589987 RepID=UPI0015BD7B3C|nr:hypothetical protein [Shewanella sp. Scap07]QLE86314.1 hypothetical protein FLM48_15275 [Shewanella sp. Scap07]
MTFWKSSVLIFAAVFFSTSLLADDNKCSSVEVPIAFDQYGLPTIELIINGKSNFALLDLGSTTGIHLPVSDIASISDVKYTGEIAKSSNISGEVFSNKQFIIPNLAIECMPFEDITGYELTPRATSIGDKPKDVEDKQQIVIGQGFFADKTIVIDYSSEKLTIRNKTGNVAAESRNKFKPYVLSDEGITIELSSPNADYQMILDTGATSSIFSANKVNTSEPLTDCDFNIGPDVKCKLFTSMLEVSGYHFVSNILIYPIDPRFTQDGFLGSDFFNQFIVELDFLNKNIALTPVTSSAM